MPRVLVVDDEADVRLVARVILEAAGHEVIEAESGERALELLSAESPPDILVLDVRMPGINGWEVMERLRRNPGTMPRLPIVVFTADIAAVEDAPVPFEDRELFLGKPFDPDELVDKVQEAGAMTA